MNKHIINLAKLGLAGASIAAIAAMVMLGAPSTEHVVAPAQADILDLFPRAARSDSAFSQLMYDEGIAGRPFDYNGNMVFFGAKTASDSPRHGLNNLQQKFVERGINEKVHLKSLSEQGLLHSFDEEHVQALLELKDPSAKPSSLFDTMSKEDLARRGALASDVLNGEIIPILNHDDYISMSGIIPKKKGQKVDPMTLNQKWKPNANGVVDLMDHTKGHRFIDLTREEDGSTTTTATWADKDFNAHKIKPDYDGANTSSDTEVPACIGCSRTFRIEGLNKNNDPFTTNQYLTQGRPDEVSEFYEQAMTRRGWKRATSQTPLFDLSQKVPSLQGLHTDVMLFERDNQYVNVFLTDDGEETSVTTLHEEKSLDKHDHTQAD